MSNIEKFIGIDKEDSDYPLYGAMYEELWRVLGRYDQTVSAATVIGLLEIIKAQILLEIKPER